jgi:hypothetical protein
LSDVDGRFSFTATQGFSGYVEFRAEGFMPSLVPFLASEEGISDTVMPMIQPADLELLASLSGYTVDPEAAQLFVQVFPCAGQDAGQVRFALNPEDPRAEVYYLLNGVPSSTRQSTDRTGQGGVVNVVPGFGTVLVIDSRNDESLSSVSYLARAGWITGIGVRPEIAQ